jgi:Stage II sporulation protein E (SpoIIE)
VTYWPAKRPQSVSFIPASTTAGFSACSRCAANATLTIEAIRAAGTPCPRHRPRECPVAGLRLTRWDGRVDEVAQNGLLLGFVEDAHYEELELPLRDEDRFLLYTDGLIEAADANDDLFGLERLKASLAGAAGLQLPGVTDTLLSSLDAWSGQPPSDLTLVLVDWKSEI